MPMPDDMYALWIRGVRIRKDLQLKLQALCDIRSDWAIWVVELESVTEEDVKIDYYADWVELIDQFENPFYDGGGDFDAG